MAWTHVVMVEKRRGQILDIFLKVEPTGLVEEADVTNGRMRGVEHDSEWSGLSSRKEDVAL